jgi:maltose alpha-D-glucosyltransferase/alpha-amylase
MHEQEWYKNAVFYEIYLRSFMDDNNDGVGDLPGLINKLDYLKQLGVDCIWLLPIYPSPRMDDGYDISDYCSIDPVYGTHEIFKHFVEETHKRNMKIVMDLVMNHTSDQHPWFKVARERKNSPYHDYYVWSDTDNLYKDARIIFVDTEKSNWTWDEKARQYYWHRFYSCQPDLNYQNPAIQAEMLNIVRFWLESGIDGFRVDAVPYLFEEDGTSCENLPKTHNFLKAIRNYIDTFFPGKVLICEANQLPKDVLQYMGNGDEFHMAFHFPLMPKIFMAIRSERKDPIEEVIHSMPAIPANCQWGTFLRNHDELTLEMVTIQERDWMWQEYAPAQNMRLNLGIRRRLAPLLNNNLEMIKLAYSLLFSLPGSPFIYYGDEIGMGDNVTLPDREGVRTPMQWTSDLNAGFSLKKDLSIPVITTPQFDKNYVNVQDNITNPQSIWHWVKNLAQIRKTENVFLTSDVTLEESGNEHLLIFKRSIRNEEIVFIHNMSGSILHVNPLIDKIKVPTFRDLLSDKIFQAQNSKLQLELKPYQSLFLKILH